MMIALQQWWTRLSPRERVLVGVAAALTILLLFWLLVRALLIGLDSQAEAQKLVFERAARIEAKAGLLAQPPERAATAAPAGPLDQIVAQLATDTGLTLDRNDPRGSNAAAIAIASARAPALITWLSGLEESGIIIERMAMTPGADGSVALTAEVRRP